MDFIKINEAQKLQYTGLEKAKKMTSRKELCQTGEEDKWDDFKDFPLIKSVESQLARSR